MFHGLIRDAQGRKMSKSIGNVIDPMDLIEGASLLELRCRIDESSLPEKEKKVSSQAQEKLYPRGIEAVGSDAMRIALLVQDFKRNTYTKTKYNGVFIPLSQTQTLKILKAFGSPIIP